MNECSESFYKENKIISSGLEAEEQIIVSVYSEPLPSPQKVKNNSKGFLEFDDVDIVYDLKSGNKAVRSLEPRSVTVKVGSGSGILTLDKEISVFESVRATVKKEVYHILDLQNECNIIDAMKEHMKEAVQFYELEYDQLVIVGCLNDLINCQKFLTSCLHKKRNALRSIKCCKSTFEQPSQETAEILIYSDDHYETEALHFNNEPDNFTLANLNEEMKCSSYELNFEEKSDQTIESCKKSSRIQPASSDVQEDALPDSLLTLGRVSEKQEFYPFSCNICSFKCTRRNHLLKHKSQHHKCTTLYYCGLCDFKTIRSSQLGKHKKIHNQENIVIVENNIQKTSKDDFSLERNELYSTSEVIKLKKHSKQCGKGIAQAIIIKDTNFHCKVCGFNGKTKKDYRTHIEAAHPIKYSCNQCGYVTYKKGHYVRHMKCVHQNERPYVCSLCPMAFKRCDALNQHQVIHAKEAKKQDRNAKSLFKCHICKKVVRSASYLKEHWLTHSEERSFLCEICGSAFKTRPVHRNHMKVVHGDDEKPFCQICGKTFATRFSLSRHMSQHGIGHGMWSNMFVASPELLAM